MSRRQFARGTGTTRISGFPGTFSVNSRNRIIKHHTASSRGGFCQQTEQGPHSRLVIHAQQGTANTRKVARLFFWHTNC